MRNVKKLAIPVVIVLILLIAGISIVSYFGSEVDLAKYIKIEGVTGLNGQGELQYGLDSVALYQDLLDEEESVEISEENYEALMAKYYDKYEEIDHALDCITVTADKESGLSNGDAVTVTATFENTKGYKLKFHFKDASTTYTVSGLTEGKTVDPFADGVVSIRFTGFSGQGTAEWDILSYEEPYSLFSYELMPAHNLSNGDIITIKATANAENLEEKGYFLPETMEMTYTVSGLAEYYDFSNSFPADELAALCDNTLSASKELENEEVQDGYTITTPTQIHKVYSMQVSDPTDFQKDYGHNVSLNNAVCVITSYYVEGTGVMALSREEWTVWVYPNYYAAADGTLGHDVAEDFDMFMLGENIGEIEQWLFDEYDRMIFQELSVA